VIRLNGSKEERKEHINHKIEIILYVISSSFDLISSINTTLLFIYSFIRCILKERKRDDPPFCFLDHLISISVERGIRDKGKEERGRNVQPPDEEKDQKIRHQDQDQDQDFSLILFDHFFIQHVGPRRQNVLLVFDTTCSHDLCPTEDRT